MNSDTTFKHARFVVDDELLSPTHGYTPSRRHNCLILPRKIGIKQAEHPSANHERPKRLFSWQSYPTKSRRIVGETVTTTMCDVCRTSNQSPSKQVGPPLVHAPHLRRCTSCGFEGTRSTQKKSSEWSAPPCFVFRRGQETGPSAKFWSPVSRVHGLHCSWPLSRLRPLSSMQLPCNSVSQPASQPATSLVCPPGTGSYRKTSDNVQQRQFTRHRRKQSTQNNQHRCTSNQPACV